MSGQRNLCRVLSSFQGKLGWLEKKDSRTTLLHTAGPADL